MRGQTIQLIGKMKSVIRLLLAISTISLLTSSILALSSEGKLWDIDHEEILATFVWYSVILGIWICFLSTLALAISAIFYRARNMDVWPSFKREVYLLLVTIASLVVLHLCLVNLN
jgi:hypothetical protein